MHNGLQAEHGLVRIHHLDKRPLVRTATRETEKPPMTHLADDGEPLLHCLCRRVPGWQRCQPLAEAGVDSLHHVRARGHQDRPRRSVMLGLNHRTAIAVRRPRQRLRHSPYASRQHIS